MSNLFLILGILFITLLVVVHLTERFGTPMDPAKQAKMSRFVMLGIMLLLIARLIQYWVSG